MEPQIEKMRPLISVVIPVYNSESTLPELRRRLEIVLADVTRNRYQIIFVNDASTDSSWTILKSFAQSNEKTSAINLTRNFGQHNALMCGFSQASGNFILTIDDDLQNPPEEIQRIFNKILEGYDVVYGISDMKKQSCFKNFGSEMVQFIYRKIFGLNNRISSFRIVRSSIVSRILSYDRSFTFIDGLLAWYTTNIGVVSVGHHKRKAGRSGYTLRKLITLALNMLTNFSIGPLQIASMTGLVFALIGFLLGTYMLAKKIFFDITISGFASLIVSVTLFSGVQLMTVGILGEYIGRMHINVSKRPQFAIRETCTQSGSKTQDHARGSGASRWKRATPLATAEQVSADSMAARYDSIQ